jgi:3,4-dihydroxy 2-butanone 4-phosphate synthase/GTP cyclohydrolase II
MITKTAETFQFDAIDDVVSDIAKGRPCYRDGRCRPRERGRLVMAAEEGYAEAINFMAMHWPRFDLRAISNERADQLGLQRMVAQNREI